MIELHNSIQHFATSKLFLSLVLLILSCGLVAGQNDTKPEPKVLLKNSVAYHFMKHIRPVDMELFVTRKMNVTPLLQGVLRVQDIKGKVLLLCNRIPVYLRNFNKKVEADLAKQQVEERQAFRVIPISSPITRPEADSRCKAAGLQLPEIYTAQSRFELMELMRQNKMFLTHAGIKYDYELNMHRFIATGYPAWQSYQQSIYVYDGVNGRFNKQAWPQLAPNSEVRFFYTKNGELGAFYENNVMSNKSQFNREYWTKSDHLNVGEFSTKALVCQARWNGSDIYREKSPRPWNHTNEVIPSNHLPADPRVKRSLSLTVNRVVNPLEELCQSVAEHLDETSSRSSFRLRNTLQQVDISLVGQLTEHEMNKRSINESANESLRPPRSIAGMVFKAGVKNIWSLIGLIEKIRIRRRIGKVETIVEKQGKTLTKLSEEIEKNSISLDQLTLVTQDLTRRLDSLTSRVEELEHRIGFIEAEVRIQQTMQLVDSMIGRTDQALDFAFTMLEGIIQHALIGQTSAFLLPANKMESLQVEVSKYSSAIIDPAYDRMRTTIISDPADPLSLACYINLFAVSRKSKELVRLIPVPTFSGNQAFAPKLDYTLVLLDQEAGVFIALDPNEEESCLADKCLISNPEMATTAPSCGIPQLFDRKLSSCINEDVYSNGMFLKQLLHDGIVYSVKQATDVQIFCPFSKMTKQQKISGAGVVHLPPGCSLSLTDDQGATSKIHSPPQSHLVETQAIELIPTGPREIFRPTMGVNPNATTNVVRLLNQHLEELDHKLAITRFDVNHQNMYVIVLGTLLGAVTILCIIIALLLYRYSRRFRRRVKKVAHEFSTNLHDAKRQFVTFEQMLAHRAKEDEADLPLMPFPPSRPEVQSHRLELGDQPRRADRRTSFELTTSPHVCGQASVKAGRLKRKSSTQSILNRLADLEFDVLALSSRPSTPANVSGYVEPGDVEDNNRSKGDSFHLDKDWRPPVPPKSGSVLALPYREPPQSQPTGLNPWPKPMYFGELEPRGKRPK